MHVDVLFISHALLYKVNLFYNLCYLTCMGKYVFSRDTEKVV